jgi:hypothetical protein
MRAGQQPHGFSGQGIDMARQPIWSNWDDPQYILPHQAIHNPGYVHPP